MSAIAQALELIQELDRQGLKIVPKETPPPAEDSSILTDTMRQLQEAREEIRKLKDIITGGYDAK